MQQVIIVINNDTEDLDRYLNNHWVVKDFKVVAQNISSWAFGVGGGQTGDYAYNDGCNKGDIIAHYLLEYDYSQDENYQDK